MAELIKQVDLIWIVLVLAVSVILLTLTVVLFIRLHNMARKSIQRLNNFKKILEVLPGCRIENLKPAMVYVDDKMNIEFQDSFKQITEDSASMYESGWIPAPQSILALPDILTAPAQVIMRKSNGFAVVLVGIVVSVLALSTILFLNGNILNVDNLRFIALIPLAISLLGYFMLGQASNNLTGKIKNCWQNLMTMIERKLPVFNQATESVRLIFQMREYDAHMANSVAILATQIESLASGKLTEAISNSVKYVVTSIVAPAIYKSIEEMGNQTQQIEQQMQQTDLNVASLYADLATRQEKQADLWLARYTDLGKDLSEQQDLIVRNLSASEQQLVDELNKSQKYALEKIVEEQRNSMQFANDVNQNTWILLQDKLATVFSQISDGQATMLDNLVQQLQQALQHISTSQNTSMAEFRQTLAGLGLQNQATTALQSSIEELFSQLLDTRKAMSEDLGSLKTSSGVMSKAAEIMGSIFEGSQSGLSESIGQMSNDLSRLSEILNAVMTGSAEQTRLVQAQSLESFEINQKHLEAVQGQVTQMSDELSTRIDQLMLGFTNVTEDLVKNVNTSINNQNDNLGGSLRSLTDIMSEEARSISLFAQQINMDIDSLNTNLKSAVSDFDTGMRSELSSTLSQFDTEVTEIVKRLARSATELGDAVDSLPEAIRHVGQK